MPGFDLLVRGARVFPGDGPGLVTDVAVTGARIAAVGSDLPTEHAREVIAGDGLMLCPGFIDLHAHSALQPFLDPRLLPKVAQGFTTELINPDGLARRRSIPSGRRAGVTTCGPSRGRAPIAGRGPRLRSIWRPWT